MKALERRVERLEQQAPQPDDLPDIDIRFVEVGGAETGRLLRRPGCPDAYFESDGAGGWAPAPWHDIESPRRLADG